MNGAEKVDRTKWDREEVFRFFSTSPCPFFAVSFQVDVTRLAAYTHEKHISFYLSLVWLCTQAMNRVENFRYTVLDGEVWLLPARQPSFTDINPGDTVFHITTVPVLPGETMEDFAARAKEKSRRQKQFIRTDEETPDLAFFSCVPGLRMTGLSSAHDASPGASDLFFPQLTWGQYERRGSRVELNMTLEMNHRFADGEHAARFAALLEESIRGLPEV